jgi:hypothetical protein
MTRREQSNTYASLEKGPAERRGSSNGAKFRDLDHSRGKGLPLRHA